jgi:hypothetical protein
MIGAGRIVFASTPSALRPHERQHPICQAPGFQIALEGIQALHCRFPTHLASVAELLAAGMPLRCVTVSTESVFDTHNNQVERLDKGLWEALAPDPQAPSRPVGSRTGPRPASPGPPAVRLRPREAKARTPQQALCLLRATRPPYGQARWGSLAAGGSVAR